jgi:hypothetical protein
MQCLGEIFYIRGQFSAGGKSGFVIVAPPINSKIDCDSNVLPGMLTIVPVFS